MITGEDYRKELCKMFQCYEWEYFLTLNTTENNYERIELKLKLWRNRIRKNVSFVKDYGYVGIFNNFNSPHIHLLMNIKYNYHPDIYKDFDEISYHWNKVSTRTCVIKDIYDNYGVCEYISSTKNTPENHFHILKPIGTSGFLNRYRLN